MDDPHVITYVDTVNGVAMFVTPSWSGRDETYTILVDLSTKMVRCDCFGSNRWGLYEDLLNPGAKTHGCRHAKAVAELIRAYME